MSNLIVPDVGKMPLMAMQVLGAPTFHKIHLWKSPHTPSHATTLADLVEADFGSYASAGLAGPVIAGALDGSGRAVVSWNAVTFTKSGGAPNSIYGYWIDSSAGDLLCVERFDVPIPMSVDGAFIQITPKFTNMSQYLNT